MAINGKIKKKLGYARVSTEGQNIENQVLELKKAGIAPENIYKDVAVSGTVAPKKRKEFKKVYDLIIKGEVDELYVIELTRLGRTSGESIALFIELENLGVRIKSLAQSEAWTKTSDDKAFRNVLVSMAAWFADIERRHISERTKLALQNRKEAGLPLGPPLKEPDRKRYEQLKATELKDAQIARVMQIPTSTLYRWVKKWEDANRIESNKKIRED